MKDPQSWYHFPLHTPYIKNHFKSQRKSLSSSSGQSPSSSSSISNKILLPSRAYNLSSRFRFLSQWTLKDVARLFTIVSQLHLGDAPYVSSSWQKKKNKVHARGRHQTYICDALLRGGGGGGVLWSEYKCGREGPPRWGTRTPTSSANGTGRNLSRSRNERSIREGRNWFSSHYSRATRPVTYHINTMVRNIAFMAEAAGTDKLWILLWERIEL